MIACSPSLTTRLALVSTAVCVVTRQSALTHPRLARLPPTTRASHLRPAAILKFTDNIVRVFAHTAAMMLTMVLELAFMGAPFSPQLLVSITIVMCSTFLYNTKPSPPRTIASKGMQKLEEEQTKLELDETTGELEPVDSLEGRTRANPTIRA